MCLDESWKPIYFGVTGQRSRSRVKNRCRHGSLHSCECWLYAGVGRAFSHVCLFVCLFARALTGKRLELSTPNLVTLYSVAVARHALIQRSKGQRSRSYGYENRHGRTVASDACCYCRRGSACRYDCLCFLVCTAVITVVTRKHRQSYRHADPRRQQQHASLATVRPRRFS